MTVVGVTNKATFSGNGATTFPFTFYVPREEDMKAVIADEEGNLTTLVLGTDYSVTGAGNSAGGSVTYPISGDPLPEEYTLTIYRELSMTQETDLNNQGGFHVDTIEVMIDRAIMLVQQLQEQINRSVKVNITADDPGDIMDEINNAKTVATIARDEALQYSSGVVVNEFSSTATAGQTSIIISGFVLPSSVNNIWLYLDGVKLPTSEYTRASDTEITLDTALVGGEVIEILSGALVDSSSNAFAAQLAAEAARDDAQAAATSSAQSAVASAGSATNAATSESNASVSASSASISATNAATSETNAATSEANAATSATNAANAQTAAETAQTGAETAQTASEAARDQALVNAEVSWLTGAGVPASGLGANNNMYFDTLTCDIYRKSSGVWVKQACVKGERGEAFNFDETGLLSARSTYDDELKDFAYLATDTGDVYIKNSDTSGDWSDPIAFKGDKGDTGTAGATILYGSVDPTTADGVDGDFYINTSSCDVFQRAAGIWTLQVNIKGDTGDTGAAGTDGATWYTGSGVPSSATGADNDLYIDTDASDVYKKASGSWSVICNIKGATGDPATANSIDLDQLKSEVKQVQRDFVLQGAFAENLSADDDILENYLLSTFIWNLPAATLQSVSAVVQVDDSGATQPAINIVIGSNTTESLSSDLTLSETEATGTINASYNTVATGERIQITLAITGENLDAENLTVRTVWEVTG